MFSITFPTNQIHFMIEDVIMRLPQTFFYYNTNLYLQHLKMQHAGLDRLADMEGIEYALIHFQYPILYVIQVETQISSIF